MSLTNADLGAAEADVERSSVAHPQRRLGVSGRWRRRDDLVIALRKSLRNHVYPLRQFVGGKPVAGIALVIEAIGDADEAWEWLVTPNARTAGKEPIEFLRRGQADAVVRASKIAVDFA